jgi:GT2 family glycosyltransferase
VHGPAAVARPSIARYGPVVPGDLSDPAPRVTVVVMTRDRREQLLHALGELRDLSGPTPVIVVDNGSSDGTPDAVRRDFPQVTVVSLGENLGAGARTAGVRLATTPYVAFSDDDSWWAPGSLKRAAELLDATPQLGLIAARTLVGPKECTDRLSTLMAHSPLPTGPGLPGPRVLGFLACAAVVRRDAYLRVGGFHPLIFFLGEETVLAQDLAAEGWQLCYVDDVVAHHHPQAAPARIGRRRPQVRNWLLSSWLRRPLWAAAADTLRVVRRASDAEVRGALLDAVRRAPRALATRRRLPPEVEADIRLLERAGHWIVPIEAGRPGPAG